MPDNIDLDIARQVVLDGLPVRTRWHLPHAPLDFDFTAARAELRSANECMEEKFWRPEWQDLLVFGDESYAEGGGATACLTIHRVTASIIRWDPEVHAPESLLNSSMNRFVQTFRDLDAHLAHGRPVPADADEFLLRVDPAAYPTSEWKKLLDYLREDA